MSALPTRLQICHSSSKPLQCCPWCLCLELLTRCSRKHIRAHHPPVQRNAGPFSCPRCFQGFPAKNDLDDHLRQPDVCHITFDQGGADPEDGITQKIIVSLEARTLKLKIDNWVSLWKLLFPRDAAVPDPSKSCTETASWDILT